MPPRIGALDINNFENNSIVVPIETLRLFQFNNQSFYCLPWIKAAVDLFLADFNVFVTELEERRLGKRIIIKKPAEIKPDVLFYIRNRALKTYITFGSYWIISLPDNLYNQVKAQRNFLVAVQIIPIYTTADFTYAEQKLTFNKITDIH